LNIARTRPLPFCKGLKVQNGIGEVSENVGFDGLEAGRRQPPVSGLLGKVLASAENERREIEQVLPGGLASGGTEIWRQRHDKVVIPTEQCSVAGIELQRLSDKILDVGTNTEQARAIEHK
jgi:hypothetical protein